MNDNADIFRKLTEGTEELIPFEHDELPDILKTKPLTGGELRQLKILERGSMKGILNVEKGMTKKEIEEQEDDIQNLAADINFADQVKNEYNTKYKAIELSTGASNRITDNFSDTLMNDLFEHIMEISNITEDKLDTLKQFRKNK